MSFNILKFIKPKNKLFYDLFEEAVTNLQAIAKKMVKLTNESDFNERELIYQSIKPLEIKSEEITQRIFFELSNNYVTPFDREDIYGLAKSIQSISYYSYHVCKKIISYKVNPLESGIHILSQEVFQSVLSICMCVRDLKQMKNTKQIIESIVKVNQINVEVENVFNICIEKLFEEEIDMREVLKRREIYEHFEVISKKCKESGLFIESVVIKYA
jgi:hypothetical protein